MKKDIVHKSTLFFHLHPDRFVGCSLSLAFGEWVNDSSWYCRPLFFSLLTSVFAVAWSGAGAASLCAGNGPHLEQRVVTTLQESRSSHHCQRHSEGKPRAFRRHQPRAFRRQKPLCHGFPLLSGSGSMQGPWGFFEGLYQPRKLCLVQLPAEDV